MNNTLRFYLTAFAFLIPITMHAMEGESSVVERTSLTAREKGKLPETYYCITKTQDVQIKDPKKSEAENSKPVSSKDGYVTAKIIKGMSYILELHDARVWFYKPANVIQLHNSKIPLTCLYMSPNGSHVITGSKSGIVNIWNTASRKIEHQCNPDNNPIIWVLVTDNAVAFSAITRNDAAEKIYTYYTFRDDCTER